MNYPTKMLRRRHLVRTLGAAGFGLITTTACAQANTQTTGNTPAATASPVAQTTTVDQAIERRPNEMKPDEALKLLADGNKRFAEGKSANPRHSFARVQDTAVDEFPFAAILCSADSRVSPEIIFDQGIGDLFVARIAGFAATPEIIESLEYAVGTLKVPLIMVMGSDREPIVQAILRDQSSVLSKMKVLTPEIKPAVEPNRGKTEGSDLSASIKANMKRQADRIRQSPILAKAIKDGSLKVVTAYYDLDDAKVEVEKA
ncbi:carbonic anhydrase [Leptolyngbya sp. NIES-3755]|nr:carbonic anhydrase [Leptolyngbya sp. NIES-3755]